jgi:two-component system phosphate regulon sensor histidine kinase PhoR
MIGKLISLLFWLFIGAGFGIFLADSANYHLLYAIVGMLVVALFLYIQEIRQIAKFSAWLRQPNLDTNIQVGAGLDEAADRILRFIKNKDKLILVGEESLRQFLAAIQASPHGVIILDKNLRIQWSNQTSSQHLGLDASLDLQQLIGNMLRNPIFTDYVNSKSYDHEIIIAGRLHQVERPHRVGIQLFPYGDGRMLLLSRDVTLIEQAETMRRDFVANVSHEIRTPLTVLSGFIETLQSLPLSKAEQEKYLELMSKQSMRLKSLVEDLLTLSRLDGRPSLRENNWNSVSKLFSQLEDEANGLSLQLHPGSNQKQKIIFLLERDSIDDEILGSGNELLSAFSNLISNAIRYTPAQGEITVAWAKFESKAVFSVKDSGPGISPEHFPRLSERFYRIDRSRSRDTGGTGLGLAIVKHVMQRHEGKLEIESKLKIGSKFSLLFPNARIRSGKAINSV